MKNVATVEVEVKNDPYCSYSCKITTLFGDHRIESHTLKVERNPGGHTTVNRHQVTVPDDGMLQVEVWEQQIMSPPKLIKHLNTPYDEKRTIHIKDKDDGDLVRVVVTWKKETTTPQPTRRHLEVEFLPNEWCPSLVYTIGDALSFTEFIMALRRILAEHPSREDILDGHPLLNLSSTRQHPVLVQPRAIPSGREWILVKLQAAVEGEATKWTTLLMCKYDLYVHGFLTENGELWEIVDLDARSVPLYSRRRSCRRRLYWGLSYGDILDVGSKDEDDAVRKKKKKKDEDDAVINIFKGMAMGRARAVEAVRTLAGFSPCRKEDQQAGRMALAVLIFMVCEPARMNPLQESIARGWLTDTGGFKEKLMREHVWSYYWSKNSRKLLAWKRNGHKHKLNRHPRDAEARKQEIEARDKALPTQLQVIHLVLNYREQSGDAAKESNNNSNSPSANESTKDSGPDHDSAAKESNNNSNSPSANESMKDGGPDHDSAAKESNNNSNSPSANESTKDGNPDHDSPAYRGQSSGSNDNIPSPDKEGSGSEGPSETESVESDGAGGNGRPLVELLAIRANPAAICKRIVLFDGKRGQIVYAKGRQGQEGEQREQELELIGPYTGISAEYGCLGIQIYMRGRPFPIEWEWDWEDDDYTDQGEPLKLTIQDQEIKTPEGSTIAKVTYAVMPNALQATVEVIKLQLKDGHTLDRSNNGTITARIDEFKVGSVLFCGKTEVQRADERSSDDTSDFPWYRLELHRNVVAVPCGSKGLHIEVNLPIKTTNGIIEDLKADLKFENGVPSKSEQNVYGNIEVNIAWYPVVNIPFFERKNDTRCVVIH